MRIYAQEDRRESLRDGTWRLSHTAVALGGFDAMHIGHQAIIRNVVACARAQGLTSVVYLFRNQPRSVLTGGTGPSVNTFSRRLAILEELGVDAAVAEWLTPAYQNIPAQTFVETYLRDWLGAEYVAAGFNYRFGRRGEGDIETLKRLGSECGIRVHSMPCVTLGGEPVSSTRIRQLIQSGRMEEAAACLGRRFSVDGKVVDGNRLGRTMGFPTANLDLPEDHILPRYGVYVSQTRADGHWYPSITNVGDKPTVTRHYPCIETHLLGYSGDLYEKEIEIQFWTYLRGITKFSGMEGLKAQLELDKQSALRYFEEKK